MSSIEPFYAPTVEPGGRKGPKPVFRELRSMQDEADSIARENDKRRKAGTSLGEIGVFYTAPFVATEVMASLTRAGIPFEWLKDPNARQWQPGHESVKLMTLHSSKGLQYPMGIIAGAGCLPWRSPAEDARLM